MNDRPLSDELAKLLIDPHLTEERGRAARRIALLSHDIAHRWARMAEVAGLPPAPGIEARRRKLSQLAEESRI
jgi:hypothetical protein